MKDYTNRHVFVYCLEAVNTLLSKCYELPQSFDALVNIRPTEITLTEKSYK